MVKCIYLLTHQLYFKEFYPTEIYKYTNTQMYKFTKTHGHYNIKPLEHTQMSINGKQVKKITG